MNTLFPPPSGRPRPHRIKTRRLIIALTCAFATHPPRRSPSARRRGAFRCNEPQKTCMKPTLADAPATNLKKCAAGARAAACNLQSAGGARRACRWKAVSCTFFSVCCAIAGRFGPFRGRPRPFGPAPSASAFVTVRLNCGFTRGGRRRGALGTPASATNRKKCAQNGAFANKRTTNRKKCAAGRPRPGRGRHGFGGARRPALGQAPAASGMHPDRMRHRSKPAFSVPTVRAGFDHGTRRPRTATRRPGDPPRPLPRGRPRVERSCNSRPAARNLHQSPLARDGRGPSARCRRGEAPTRQTGDLWRFRKANAQVGEP